MPNFKRKFLGLLVPVMGIAALTSCDFLTGASGDESNQDVDSVNVRSQVDNGLDGFDYSFIEENSSDSNQPIEVNPLEEEIPQEKVSNPIDLTLNKKEIELDAGKSREFKKVSDSLTGSLNSAFDSYDDITCSYSEGNGYSLNDLTIRWSIPTEDSEYFSLNVLNNNLGTSTVRVTAIKESRLSSLNVNVVLKNDESTILASSECEIRSVLTNAYWVDNYEKTFLGGEDVTAFGTGYTARLYNNVYNDNEDLVIPSKINIDGVVKPLRRLVGFSKSDGSDKINGTSYITCRNLYIPNSIIQLSSYALCYVKPTNKIIFDEGEQDILYCTSTSIYIQGEGQSNGNYLYNQVLYENVEVSFPYDSYLRNIGEKATSHSEMSLIKDVSLTYLFSVNNSESLLFK